MLLAGTVGVLLILRLMGGKAGGTKTPPPPIGPGGSKPTGQPGGGPGGRKPLIPGGQPLGGPGGPGGPGGKPLGGPIPVPGTPLTSIPLPLIPRREPSRNGCDFAIPSWSNDGEAFTAQDGDTIPGREVRIRRQSLVPLGGDYWHIPYRRGNRDPHWFGTPFGNQRDAATGEMTSREFEITFNYLAFLVAGGQDDQRLRIELLVRPQGLAAHTPGLGAIAGVAGAVAGGAHTQRTVSFETGRDDDRFRQVVWDVRDLQGQIGMVRLVDNSPDGHLDIADLHCSMERPRPFVQPIWGWADIHAHPMANIGFGGQLIYGSAGGTLADLGHCEAQHGVGGTFFGTEALMSFLPFLDAAGVPEQGSVSGGVGHLTGGWPEFDGWPRHTSTIHQTMHWEWVRRAFDGGQRLLVALVVNAEALADMFPGPHPAGDDATTTEQIRIWTATIPAWAEVALTPVDARRIIGEDRLAIVLGLEVDRALGLWGNWDELNLTPEAARPLIRQRIAALRDLGIRQLNPIHLADNVFGGSAVYKDDFNATEYKLHHAFLEVEGQPAHAPEDEIGFRLNDTFEDWFVQLTTTGVLDTAGESPVFPDYGTVDPGRGHRNRAGLSPIGVVAMEELRAAGMVIDIDHMSEHSTHDALAQLVPADSPGVSGHATFRATAPRRRWGDEEHPRNGGEAPHTHAPFERADSEYWPHESEKTAAVLAQIAALRGVIAPITGGLADRLTDPSGQIANDSSGSSKTWAQEFLYARRGMGNRGIALGTDAVALLAQPGARFGPQASWGLRVEPDSVAERRWQADRQSNGVTYADPIRDYRAHRFATTDVYDQEERDIWEATAIVKAGLNPWHPDQQPDGPGFFNRTAMVQNKINNIAKGLLATSAAQLENPLVFGGDTYAEQRAAFLVAQNPLSSSPTAFDIPALPDAEPQRVRELFPRIWRIWQMWARMDSQMPGVPNNEPLTRSVAGRRDFDINIDGVAHYGMFTDFLQDLANVGLAPDDRSVIFRSAEDYIEVWERCEHVRTHPVAGVAGPAGLGPPTPGTPPG